MSYFYFLFKLSYFNLDSQIIFLHNYISFFSKKIYSLKKQLFSNNFSPDCLRAPTYSIRKRACSRILAFWMCSKFLDEPVDRNMRIWVSQGKLLLKIYYKFDLEKLNFFFSNSTKLKKKTLKQNWELFQEIGILNS